MSSDKKVSLYSRFFISVIAIMLVSTSAFRPFFITAARFNSNNSMKYATSFKEDILNKQVATSGLTEKNFPKDAKLGVLFLNLGGPETLKDVEGFLYNLFADPDIIRLPRCMSLLQKPLAWFIAKRRAPKSSIAYQSIGGGSPIVKYTKAQSDLVRAALKQRGFEQTKTYFAMRYWHPFTEEVLKEIQNDKIDTLVVVPLYPQFSVSTSGSSLKLLNEIFQKEPNLWGSDKLPHTVVPAWYNRPGYVNTMAKLVLDQVVKYNETEMRQGLHVLFSAHGVPESYIENGDPYQKQITECVALVSREVVRQLASDKLRPRQLSAATAKALSVQLESACVGGSGSGGDTCSTTQDPSAIKGVTFHLSFQSRVGPVQWLRPYTDDMIKIMGNKEQVRNLIVVPVSFVSEHIETLEEIDMEYRELAEEHGVTHWERAPALNTEQTFIEDVADMVMDALDSPTLTIAEAVSKGFENKMNQQVIPGLDTSIVKSLNTSMGRVSL